MYLPIGETPATAKLFDGRQDGILAVFDKAYCDIAMFRYLFETSFNSLVHDKQVIELPFEVRDAFGIPIQKSIIKSKFVEPYEGYVVNPSLSFTPDSIYAESTVTRCKKISALRTILKDIPLTLICVTRLRLEPINNFPIIELIRFFGKHNLSLKYFVLRTASMEDHFAGKSALQSKTLFVAGKSAIIEITVMPNFIDDGIDYPNEVKEMILSHL